MDDNRDTHPADETLPRVSGESRGSSPNTATNLGRDGDAIVQDTIAHGQPELESVREEDDRAGSDDYNLPGVPRHSEMSRYTDTPPDPRILESDGREHDDTRSPEERERARLDAAIEGAQPADQPRQIRRSTTLPRSSD